MRNVELGGLLVRLATDQQTLKRQYQETNRLLQQLIRQCGDKNEQTQPLEAEGKPVSSEPEPE